jgi:hypothetical protein
MARYEPSIEELIQSIHRRTSGIGGVVYDLPPLRCHLAKQIVDGPCSWLIPVMTTEASPRLVSCANPDGSTHHVIVWDERYSHYLTRIIEAHQALLCTQPSFETAARAVAVIAWDFVLEQLCPENRISRLADDSARVRRVFGHTFAHCTKTRSTEKQILDSLLGSAEMNDPRVKELLKLTVRSCCELALDHEAHHYLRRHASDWDTRAPVPLAEMETLVLDLLSVFDRFITTGALPAGRTWSFFETVLAELPMSFLREEFEGTERGEEIQCDLVPLMYLCVAGKNNVGLGCSEMEEFKSIATCYQAGRAWQIASIFLAGLRIEVARALGREVRLTSFRDSDLGLRLMLGNWMCHKILTEPPYAEPGHATSTDDKPFVELMESTRPIAQAITEIYGDGSSECQRRHRALLLDTFERSDHHWLKILNAVGLEITDRLNAFVASSGQTPPVPSIEDYLEFLDIYSAKRMTQKQRRKTLSPAT